MNYISGVYTDVGIRKKTNEDSVLVQHAQTPQGEVVFGMICDGMGGLARGELASATVIRAYAEWFRSELPQLLAGGTLDEGALRAQWKDLMLRQDRRIADFGTQVGVRLGTTLTCVLLFGGRYYAANIGDSRVYLIDDQLYQITHDHTLVQRDLDMGLITFQQSLVDPRRSILLQCIGASDYVEPDFFGGSVHPGQRFLLCCDGFRHVVTPHDIFGALNAQRVRTEQDAVTQLRGLTELGKSRGETDNISAALICVN